MTTHIAITLIGISVLLQGYFIINIFKRLKKLEMYQLPGHRLWRK